MKLFTGILILTILVVFFIYYSKSHKNMNTKKTLKETFIDSSFAKNAFHDTVQVTDADIEAKEEDIKEKEEDLEVLEANLMTLNRNIDEKRTQLNTLRGNDSYLSGQLDTLNLDINMLTAEIREFSDKAFVKEPTSIDISILTQVQQRKETINSEINTLKTKINNSLVHYDEADISTIQQIGDLQTGLIKDLNDVKAIYDRVYKVMKKNASFMEVCSGESLDGYPQYVKDYINSFDIQNICRDIDVTNVETNFTQKIEQNYTLGSNICSTKKGTCIYERSDQSPKSYYTDTFDYKFYRHRWPQENSCEAQNSNCFSLGTLSDSACDGDIKTLYFTKEHAKAEYYSSNVGYRSRELPEDPGNWECIVDHPTPWIDSESNIIENARNNCEGGGPDGGYGESSYQCYSVTSDEINPTKAEISNSMSKTWNSTLNSDGSIGECDINTTCRTKNDAQQQVICLGEKFAPEGNYQCHTLSADGNSAVPGKYRNTYELGTWDSATNRMGPGKCVTKIGECRTKQDVEAEIDCLTTDNWSCANFNEEPSATNIGNVTVVTNTDGRTKKNYSKMDYDNLNNSNKGVGTCNDARTCLSPTELQVQADCHNNDNYLCWTVDGTNATKIENRVFKTYNETTNVCDEDSSCLTEQNALSIAEEACYASVTDRCYKIDDTDATNLDGSKSIIYDEGDSNQYPDGRKTMFTITPTVNPIKGNCSTRDDCESDLNTLCGRQTVNCYDSASSELNAPTTTETSMVYNGDPDNMKCVPPEGCSLIPHCSYMTVHTGNANMFKATDIDQVDCSEGNPYGKKYAWNLETNTSASVANPGSYVNIFENSDWSAIIDGSAENTHCVRDPSKVNDPLPLTGISEDTVDFSCQACPYESVDSDDGWTSQDVPGTTNAQGTFNVFTSTSGDEEVVIIPGGIGSGLTDNGDETITYDTRASNQDACPDPRDPSVKDISVYAQKKVVEHRRTIGPEPSAGGGCHAKNKIEVKYTLEDAGARCPFDCVYYWGSNVTDPTEFYDGCYECQPTFGDDGGGFETWLNDKCAPTNCKTQTSHRYPKRLSRERNNEGQGCSGNGLNPGDEDSSGNADVDKRNWYNNWLALKKDCDLTECPVDCVLGTPSGWGDCSESCGSGTQTRTWNIQTQPAHGGKNCQTVFDELSSTAKESGEGFDSITGNTLTSKKACKIKDCCTAVTGTWTEWTDLYDNKYGTNNTPNCPTDLCNSKTIELTRTSVNRVTCNADGTENRDPVTQEHTCEANATPSAGSISDWSSCPLCVYADQTATQTGTRRGKTECIDGRIVYVTDSSETRDCNPQPPTCGETDEIRENGACTPNAGATCDWTGSSPYRQGTIPVEIEHNIPTGTGKEWRDYGTIDCTVPCTMPEAPTNLSASNITHNSFVLSWTPNDNGDATLSSYKIRYQSFVSDEGGTSTGLWQNIENVPSSSTSHTITGLESRTDYNVRVKKVFTSGPSYGIESSNRKVQTTKLTNKVSLFFEFTNLYDSPTDVIRFKFKDNGVTYVVNDLLNPDHFEDQDDPWLYLNNREWSFEEGGYAIFRGNRLLLYNFDLANLDFIEIKVFPSGAAPYRRFSQENAAELRIPGRLTRTFKKFSDDIKNLIEDKVPFFQGSNFVEQGADIRRQKFHKIKALHSAIDNTYQLRYLYT